ncbi:MAG: sensor histidine kinase [Anaerolineales bacterium]
MNDFEKTNAELIEELQALRTKYETLENDCHDAMQAAILRLRTMEALKFASLHLSASMELRTMLENILQLIFDLLPAANVHVFIYDQEKEALTFGAALMHGQPQPQPHHPPRRHGMTYTAALTGERIIVENVYEHPLFQDFDKGVAIISGALVGIPLKVGDLVVGVLNIGFADPRIFSEIELDIMELFAQQAAVAVENARLYRQVSATAEQMQALREQDRRYYEELNRTQSLLMNMVSHDVRNPIGVIKGYVKLLRSNGRTDDELGQEALGFIESGADRILELVTDLLDLARLETGLALNLEAVSLHHLFEQNLKDFRFSAQEKSIDLVTILPPRDLVLRVDPKRMGQVIANLVSNAIKYTPDGGRVVIQGEQVENGALIKVRDTGLGIPSEEIDHLFDKFYRVKAESHAEIEGTGLGLAIVKTIVEQHEGMITVQSEHGQGSEFTILLPFSPAVQTAV